MQLVKKTISHSTKHQQLIDVYSAGNTEKLSAIWQLSLANSKPILVLCVPGVITLILGKLYSNNFLKNFSKNSIVPGALFEISKSDEKKLDIYEDFPILYKKQYFYYYGKKVMTYTMVKKTPFRFPTERYLNVVKHGYKDCDLNDKYLKKSLNNK